MPNEYEFLQANSLTVVWQRYCGFLDLNLDEFYRIQQRLVAEQIGLIANSPLHRELLRVTRGFDIERFRETLPLTTYKDYAPYLQERREDMLTEKPYYWVNTSTSRGAFKFVPWTYRFDSVQCRNVIAALILSSSRRQGNIPDVTRRKALNLFAGRSFVSGLLAQRITEQLKGYLVPPLGQNGESSFTEKVDKAIIAALECDVDFVIGTTSALLRVTQRFDHLWNSGKHTPGALFKMHPLVIWRLLRRNRHTKTLPGNAWSLKGLITWGADSDVFEKDIEQRWGRKPLQMYGSSESGIMAVQAEDRSALAFLPDSVFFEFIPEAFINEKAPPTMLINEVEEGKAYELVITNFYGMPFVRYRQGDRIKIVRNGTRSNGVPRMIFLGRADDTVDLFGIARLNTEVVSEALYRVGLSHRGWCLRKEYDSDQVTLKLYIELGEGDAVAGLERRLSRALKSIDLHFAEAVYTMEYNPLKVISLPRGAFDELSSHGGSASQPLVRVNPPDSVVEALIRLVGEKR